MKKQSLNKIFKKQLKSQLFSKTKNLNISQNNKAIIDFKVNNFKNIYGLFNTKKEKALSNNFSGFLEREVSLINKNYCICLELNDLQITTEQINIFNSAIKQHYFLKILSIKQKLKRNRLKVLTYFILSIISLILNFLTKQFETFFVNETLLILSWFFLWEGSNVFVFNKFNLKQKLFNYLRLYNCTIIHKKTS